MKCDGDDTNSAGIASICTVEAPGTGGPTAIPPQGVYVPAEDLAGVAGFTDNIAIRAGFKDPITSDVSYGIAVESGDIKLVIKGLEYVVEIKYIAVDVFPNVFKVLENRNIAMYKRKTGEPRWVAIIPDKIFKEIIK